MAQSIEEVLLQVIKKDDVKAFDSMEDKVRDGVYRLGRFPVLSLLYLYNSRKILSVYEERLLQNSTYEALSEPVEISKRFSSKAGKCLRLYLNNEIVSPSEMLLILDKTKHLKNVYPLTKSTASVRGRLKSIYFIKYALSVKFEGDGIVIDKRPLGYREKRNIIAICLSAILMLALIASVIGVVVPFNEKIDWYWQIDFNSEKEYTLKRDIILPENFSVEAVNCKITGNGKKITFRKGASLGEFNGEMSDLILESSGTPIFSDITLSAVIENVTVNVDADVVVEEGSAFVALTNHGTIQNVNVNVRGKMSAIAMPKEDDDEESPEELTCGGLVLNNSYTYYAAAQTVYVGVINNCTVNYSDFTLVGQTGANAAFGGVAGVNEGYVRNCTVKGKILSDTFDIAGICATNNRLLSNNVNEAELSQTSSDTGWNPVVCGIVMSNAAAVENCENKGKISSVSTCGRFDVEEGEPAASAAGIAYMNTSTDSNYYIKDCTNSGSVECVSEYRNVFAAGICILSRGAVEGCKNVGNITATADNNYDIYVGGIDARAYGYIYKSVNEGSISATGSGTAYIGGISAHSFAQFLTCLSKGEITVTARRIFAGGIFGYGDAINASNSSIYGGTADYCISENSISVNVIGDTPAYVGGIAGYVSEVVDRENSEVYRGGRVNNCYFIGEFKTKGSYYGSIVGVCGANIYEVNLYEAGNDKYNNFKGNYYSVSQSNAFGATVNADGGFVSVEDKEAAFASKDYISNLREYQLILNTLES